MSEFVLHPQAYADLDEICEHMAADKSGRADRTREELYEAIQSLVPFPYIGHARPDLTANALRFQSVGEARYCLYPGRKAPRRNRRTARTPQSACDRRHPAFQSLICAEKEVRSGRKMGGRPTFVAKGGQPAATERG